LRISGIGIIDRLLEPLRREWVVEFFGDRRLTSYLMHHLVAFNGSKGRVYLILAQEFGGLRTDLISALCRVYGCLPSNVIVARAFSSDDVKDALRRLSDDGLEEGVAVLAYPYNYLPNDPQGYSQASEISGLIMKATLRHRLTILSTVTKFGDVMPEGGSLHHHIVKVIVKVFRSGGRAVAEIVKHPAKRAGARAYIHVKLLDGLALQEPPQRTLLQYATLNTAAG
jgi:hypothetical protein